MVGSDGQRLLIRRHLPAFGGGSETRAKLEEDLTEICLTETWRDCGGLASIFLSPIFLSSTSAAWRAGVRWIAVLGDIFPSAFEFVVFAVFSWGCAGQDGSRSRAGWRQEPSSVAVGAW
jgi:hypothetical protein